MKRSPEYTFKATLSVTDRQIALPWHRRFKDTIAFGLASEDNLKVGILLGQYDQPLTYTTTLELSAQRQLTLPTIPGWDLANELVAINMQNYVELWRPEDLETVTSRQSFEELADCVINNNPHYNPFRF